MSGSEFDDGVLVNPPDPDFAYRNDTCLIGYMDASFADLVTAFGEPNPGDNYKQDAEWLLVLPGRTVVTIYNYKTGKAYLGKKGTSLKKERAWHIGGHMGNDDEARRGLVAEVHALLHSRLAVSFRRQS